MENASKALIMAGSILMALIVIGALTFMYTNVSEVEQTKTDAETEGKISDYLARFEQYNRESLYGSEILSLANLQEDYNKTQADVQGYTKITILVNIKTEIAKEDGRTYYLTKGEKNINEVIDALIKKNNSITSTSSLESDLSYYETEEYENTGKTVKYFSQINYRTIAEILNVPYNSTDDEYEILEKIQNSNSKNKKLIEEIDKYKNLKSSYTQFKNTKFKCTEVEYDQNGRIKAMCFEEEKIGS